MATEKCKPCYKFFGICSLMVYVWSQVCSSYIFASILKTKQEIETLENDILHIKQAIEAKKAPMMVSKNAVSLT